MAKYTPNTKEELQALVKDESIHLGDIDTSKITDMSELFKNSTRTDFSGIEKWNTSKVTNMAGMFWFCERFNQDLSSWDVSNVKNMSGMFYNCYYFNQPLGDWDVGKVENMKEMFHGCLSFNQNISKWDVSSVGDMESMFYCCENFNQDLSSWDVSKVENMSWMFSYCTSFNQDISKWDVSNVKDMANMFAFNQPSKKEVSKGQHQEEGSNSWDVSESGINWEEIFSATVPLPKYYKQNLEKKDLGQKSFFEEYDIFKPKNELNEQFENYIEQIDQSKKQLKQEQNQNDIDINSLTLDDIQSKKEVSKGQHQEEGSNSWDVSESGINWEEIFSATVPLTDNSNIPSQEQSSIKRNKL
ncbi:TPA: BspA family leucine-rich repeat surface protein [Campylobacter jejuni]|nr:BspA family leucine-rich repeat surface protein [Campylobacter jejuni]